MTLDLDLFHYYFLSLNTLIIFVGIVVTYLVCYSLYRMKPNDPAGRSNLLQPMVASSIFFWGFLGASLLLCTVLLDQYQVNSRLTISEVLGGSLLTSLAFAVVMSLIGRRHVYSGLLENMKPGTTALTGIANRFGLLCSKMGVQQVFLREATVGNAFSASLRGQGVVAISPELAGALSPDETEAVLAHELSHIRNRDSVAKGLARLARIAFPFDPVLRLVEAALHRERELWADRVSAEFTKKPLALAYALIKASSSSMAGALVHAEGSFVGHSGRGLLSLYPSLERRVNALIELAHQMEVAGPPYD